MPKDRYHHGDVERALIAAATAQIERAGPEGFSLAKASREIGVSHAAAYRYFDGKEALLAAVAQAGMLALRDALQAAWEHACDPRERYLASGRALVGFALAHPRWYALAMGGVRDDDLRSLAEAGPETAFAHLQRQIARWQAEGWLRGGEPLEQGLLLWSTAHGLASLVASGRLKLARADVDALSDRLLLSLREGLAP